MKIISMPASFGCLQLDYCSVCNQVWFDSQEYETLPPPQPARDENLSPRLAEALAIYKIEAQKKLENPVDGEPPDSLWQLIPAAFGMPAEFNDSPSRKPLFTWLLSAVMVVLAVVMIAAGATRAFIDQWGFVPCLWSRDAGLTIFTSFFLHGGVMHAVSNVYFLMVFGDNVEDDLGKGKFLLLLAISHLAGLAVHSIGDPHGEIPLVGASGGIAGILSYYALKFPHAKLGLVMGYSWMFRWFRISAIWWLVLYVVLQLIGSYTQINGVSGVSHLAHLGGLAAGLAAGMWVRFRPSTRVLQQS